MRGPLRKEGILMSDWRSAQGLWENERISPTDCKPRGALRLYTRHPGSNPHLMTTNSAYHPLKPCPAAAGPRLVSAPARQKAKRIRRLQRNRFTCLFGPYHTSSRSAPTRVMNRAPPGAPGGIPETNEGGLWVTLKRSLVPSMSLIWRCRKWAATRWWGLGGEAGMPSFSWWHGAAAVSCVACF